MTPNEINRAKAELRKASPWLARKWRLVKLKDDHIVIKHKDGYYEIALSTCETHKKILDWVVHISQKKWATRQIIELFVLHACDHVSKRA
jgi:hypothetical protein